ncbi:DUF305 domain-containing protein [Pseudonocardia sp. GCM10023141]|uniref:DUF305 domain-containing protein n=1 Tax=Pseudonocardia sp. GCM10023141 TaxID=3252653 RepID=UPI00360E7473
MGVGAAVALLLLGAAAALVLTEAAGTSSAPDAVDIGFGQDMSEHHLNAVTMAVWAREHSTDPVVRQLAFDIESTQTAQVGTMHGWLDLWGAPSSTPTGHMEWMAVSPLTHRWAVQGHDAMSGGPDRAMTPTPTPTPTLATTLMPGLAGTEDLRRLRASTGRELDVWFLQLMIRHHRAGVPMLSDAAGRAGNPVVRNLAAQMLLSQTSDTEVMMAMLAARGGQPLTG